ncbi:MAG: hypothetical protein ACOX8S_12610 [Christensenellales bacterium]|jgi:hypothetical protein
MKKRRLGIALIVAGLTLAALTFFFINGTIGRKPFSDISAGDIKSASVRAIAPNETAPVVRKETFDELAEILRQVTIYRRDDSGRNMAGQLITYTVELTSGQSISVGAYGSYMYIGDVCYKAEYEPSEALNSLGNKIIRGEK